MNTTEIAQKLGISRGTVSRVINGHPNVNEHTRRMVLAELEASGYQPNQAARLLVMQRKWRIAVIVFSEPHFFWEQVRAGVQNAGAQLQVHGVTADYFETDILQPQQQVDLLRRLPREGYDAIALAPNDVRLLPEEIDRVVAGGTPVLLMNVDIPSANRLCYVGCDDEQGGELAAELLWRTQQTPGEVLLLTLEDPIAAIDRRITGFRRAYSRHCGAGEYVTLRFGRMAAGVYDQLLAQLTVNPRVTGIYVAIGALEQAAQAVVDAGRMGQVTVIGHDLSQAIYRYLRLGAITATVCHEPYNQGYYGVKLLHNYLVTKRPPAHNIFYCKLEAIFAGNARYYLDQADQLERQNL